MVCADTRWTRQAAFHPAPLFWGEQHPLAAQRALDSPLFLHPYTGTLKHPWPLTWTSPTTSVEVTSQGVSFEFHLVIVMRAWSSHEKLPVPQSTLIWTQDCLKGALGLVSHISGPSVGYLGFLFLRSQGRQWGYALNLILWRRVWCSKSKALQRKTLKCFCFGKPNRHTINWKSPQIYYFQGRESGSALIFHVCSHTATIHSSGTQLMGKMALIFLAYLGPVYKNNVF